MTSLLAYNEQLSQLISPNIPETLRTHWLWNLNLKEEVTASDMLNESHLTALVLCRADGLARPVIHGTAGDLFDTAVVQTAYQALTMKDLHDSVEHAQMHMQDLIATPHYKEHLDLCTLGAVVATTPRHPRCHIRRHRRVAGCTRRVGDARHVKHHDSVVLQRVCRVI